MTTSSFVNRDWSNSSRSVLRFSKSLKLSCVNFVALRHGFPMSDRNRLSLISVNLQLLLKQHLQMNPLNPNLF
jgi:hypothetical protein